MTTAPDPERDNLGGGDFAGEHPDEPDVPAQPAPYDQDNPPAA